MVQKAYNPGGTTIRVDTSSPDSFKAETLWDYEIFARAELAGGRASLSGNLFYYDMRNAQRAESIIVVTPSGRRAGFANQFNVPKARTLGAEGQARWRVDDALSARVAIGLLSTRVIDTDEESAALQGKQFDRAPHFSGTLAIDWRATERLQLSGQLRHHSAYFTDAENLFENRIGGGTNVDARAEYRLGKAAIFAQVRNLFDSFNLLDRFSDEAAEAEPPRTFAVGVETAF
jgi:outer membrane receptor protein involved in Fe transport